MSAEQAVEELKASESVGSTEMINILTSHDEHSLHFITETNFHFPNQLKAAFW